MAEARAFVFVRPGQPGHGQPGQGQPEARDLGRNCGSWGGLFLLEVYWTPVSAELTAA